MLLLPIATAPRNGTYVLLFGPSGYTTTPLRCAVCRYDARYRPRTPWITHSNRPFVLDGAEPTHWMPLPNSLPAIGTVLVCRQSANWPAADGGSKVLCRAGQRAAVVGFDRSGRMLADLIVDLDRPSQRISITCGDPAWVVESAEADGDDPRMPVTQGNSAVAKPSGTCDPSVSRLATITPAVETLLAEAEELVAECDQVVDAHVLAIRRTDPRHDSLRLAVVGLLAVVREMVSQTQPIATVECEPREEFAAMPTIAEVATRLAAVSKSTSAEVAARIAAANGPRNPPSGRDPGDIVSSAPAGAKLARRPAAPCQRCHGSSYDGDGDCQECGGTGFATPAAGQEQSGWMPGVPNELRRELQANEGE